MLEVACGKRPIETQASGSGDEDVILVDWVLSFWSRGAILEAADPKLGGDYVVEEMELVLKLGLLCCNSIPGGRPTMGQVMEFLSGDAPVPDLLSSVSASGFAFTGREGFDNFVIPNLNSSLGLGNTMTTSGVSVANSVLSTGR
uniref:Uncharacterized protein n=1 Tax=Nelumbo nucifera TaxID=4432 RepID=A0A822YAG2_NELNU|nr:TPA_asm: hypothetical protein HUJ06_029737 [Nelumbo nucifera]